MTLLRQFDLLKDDAKFLEEYGLPWETIVDKDQWVLVHEFPLPKGYNQKTVTVAIRLITGYPDAPLDMVYVYPHLARVDGHSIEATSGRVSIGGKEYQQWSRHRTEQNPWIVGKDNLGTQIILAEDWFEREFEK